MIQQHCYLLLLATLMALTPRCCHSSDFLSTPQVQWTYRLPGSGTLSGRGLRQGNEVLASPDGTRLFVTTDDGSLHFITLNQLQNSFVFEPATIPGTSTECRSGVTMVYHPITRNLDYVVYTVIDVPIRAGVLYDGMTYDPSRTSTLSRLLAVNLDGTLRYSVPLNGFVVGKPVAGNSGDRLYVAHNIPNFIGPSATRGKLSVILANANPPTVTASLSPLNQHGPFGPPTATTVMIQGKQQDMVVVAEAWGQGYTTGQGKVYLLRPSALYTSFNGQGNDAYEFKLVSDWTISSAARPTLKADATEVFVGAAGARLGGWTSDSNLFEGVVSGDQSNLVPSWGLELETNKGNASQPLLVAPILSLDEALLYQVGASTQMYCIDTQKGEIVWKSDGALRGAVVAEPRLSDEGDEPKLYVIEGMKGKVRQHDALTGGIDWTIDCQSVSGIICNDAVEAEFSVSPNGNVIYYGDIFGKIVALEVAGLSTPSPTAAPTPKPTAKPTEEVEEERTKSPTTAPVTKVPVTPSPVVVVPATPAPSFELGIDSIPFEGEGDTEAPTEEDSDSFEEPNTITLVDTSGQRGDDDASNLEFSSAAAIDGDEGSDSFFSNDIMIVLVAVCGGLALAIIVLLIAQKARSINKQKGAEEHIVIDQPEDDGKVEDWHSAQDEYEEACRRNEEETLREIVGLAAKTPTKGSTRRNSKKSKRMSPVTPSTLASIEESPTENELSFVSDATPDAKPKNLEKSFDASLAEEQGREVTLMESRVHKDTKAPLGSIHETNYGNVKLTRLGSGSREINSSVELDAQGFPRQNSSGPGVEVVATGESPRSKQQQAQSAISTDPVGDPPLESANDLLSVDGSMYLDDDSKFDVASLSHYSMASTTDGGHSAELCAHYPHPTDGGLRYEMAHSSTLSAQYMKPPQAASPFSQSSMSPTPMSPKDSYVATSPTSELSTSPVTPPTADSGYGREVIRTGQSARPGGSDKQGRGREEKSRTPSPPAPPVGKEEEEDDEPDDAWNSFLSELAKAERDFFNPSFSKKKKTTERPQSPPPPPPPDYPPPDGAPPPPPPDPPVGKHRKLLM